MSVGVAKAILVGMRASAVTTAILFAMVMGYFVFWLVAPRRPLDGLEVPAFYVFNPALAAIAVVVPTWLALSGARRYGVSPALSMLGAVVFMGLVAWWLLAWLTNINGCVSGINFPLGGGPYCDRPR